MRAILIKTSPLQKPNWLEVEGTLKELKALAGIDYGERVNTPICREHDFVAVVDEDGHDRMLRPNPVGQHLIGYPTRDNNGWPLTIVGPMLLLSEEMMDDPEDPGIDFVSLKDKPKEWIIDILGKLS